MLSKDIAQAVAEAYSAIITKEENTIAIMYNNDGYKYAYDKLTRMFYVINPLDSIIYANRNPIKVHTQYEMYVSLAFRKRIAKRGYNCFGEKINATA